jgi:hypothetical protein
MPGAAAPAQPPATPSLVGVWTLNTELSDKPPDGQAGDGRGGRGRGGDRGGGRRGGGGGGFGGGRGGRGGGFGDGRGGQANPEDMQRRRDALRDIMVPPERMTITTTESMVIITTGDGRTTRLATNGSKVKDDSTGIEQRSHWDRDRLVTEISGAQGGKVTQTYTVDSASHRLTVTVEAAGGRGGAAAARHHVYDADAR